VFDLRALVAPSGARADDKATRPAAVVEAISPTLPGDADPVLLAATLRVPPPDGAAARAFLDAGPEVMAEEVVAVPSPAEVAAGLSALDQNGNLRA
jgi:hypothetical protein